MTLFKYFMVPDEGLVDLNLYQQAINDGYTVVLLQPRTELTVEQAADILNVHPVYFKAQLLGNKFPVIRDTMLGPMVRASDVLTYKAERDTARHQALRELTEMSQESGFYTAIKEDGET